MMQMQMRLRSTEIELSQRAPLVAGRIFGGVDDYIQGLFLLDGGACPLRRRYHCFHSFSGAGCHRAPRRQV